MAGTADREVLQPARDEAPRLVVAEARAARSRAGRRRARAAVLVGGEPEEGVLLLDRLGHGVVHRALAVNQLGLGLELLASDAVEARVDALVDVAVVVDPLQELPDELLVPVVGRPNEEVVRRVEASRELPPDLRDPVDVLLRRQALLRASRETFVACSSTPVRKNVSSPRCRWCRAKTSAATVVYACPMCGVEFT